MPGNVESRIRGRDWLVLAGILVLGTWLRLHTVGPTLSERLGLGIWPVTTGESEPLDCDEAAYAYMGHRLNAGDALYRDLFENKPPLGYWLYALAVAVGGYDELTVRLMPIPLVLGTTVLLWWIAHRLGGASAANVAAWSYVLLSTDPHVFGNGAHLEHPINFFSVAAMAALVRSCRVQRHGLANLFFAGGCLAAASLVRQVSIVKLPLFLAAALLDPPGERPAGGVGRRLRAAGVLLGGFLSLIAVATAVLAAQGSLSAARECAVAYAWEYSRLAGPAGPEMPGALRWLVGEADAQRGRLPWPFGSGSDVDWWGAGSWPIWLTSVLGIGWLVIDRRGGGPRRLIAAWAVVAAIEVALPGTYWQHYYLLLAPPGSLAVALFAAGLADRARRAAAGGRIDPAVMWGFAAILAVVSVAVTTVGLVRGYLLVEPAQLTERYKGGRAWPQLRRMGQEIGRRAGELGDARLCVWGWQSPLHVYSGLDGVSRVFFADRVLLELSIRDPGHPAVRSRLEEIERDVRRGRPEVIFVGAVPFPALGEILTDQYVGWRVRPGSRSGEGIWVRRDVATRFEGASP